MNLLLAYHSFSLTMITKLRSGVMMETPNPQLSDILESWSYEKASDFSGKILHGSDIQFFNVISDFYSNKLMGRLNAFKRILAREAISPAELLGHQSEDFGAKRSVCRREVCSLLNVRSYVISKAVFTDISFLLRRFVDYSKILVHVLNCLDADAKHLDVYGNAFSLNADCEKLFTALETQLLQVFSLLLLVTHPQETPTLTTSVNSRNKQISNTHIESSRPFNIDKVFQLDKIFRQPDLISLKRSEISIVHAEVLEKLKTYSSETSFHINK